MASPPMASTQLRRRLGHGLGHRQHALERVQRGGAGAWRRVRSHCRFRNRSTASLSKSGVKWMSGSAKVTIRDGREKGANTMYPNASYTGDPRRAFSRSGHGTRRTPEAAASRADDGFPQDSCIVIASAHRRRRRAGARPRGYESSTVIPNCRRLSSIAIP
jgi:hypothetical protein